MKYSYLASGDEKDWKALTEAEQDELLAEDEKIRQKGTLTSALQTYVVTVRAWDGVSKTVGSTVVGENCRLLDFPLLKHPI